MTPEEEALRRIQREKRLRALEEEAYKEALRRIREAERTGA